MVTTTETRADYSQIISGPVTTSIPSITSNVSNGVYRCDLFGDNYSLVFTVNEESKVPSWFRRQCQRFFLGTKWTKL